MGIFWHGQSSNAFERARRTEGNGGRARVTGLMEITVGIYISTTYHVHHDHEAFLDRAWVETMNSS